MVAKSMEIKRKKQAKAQYFPYENSVRDKRIKG